MSDVLPSNRLNVHEVSLGAAKHGDILVAGVAERLGSLVKQLSEEGREVVWPPVEVRNADNSLAGFVVASLAALPPSPDRM